jgi:hypothetical protein
MRIWLACFVVMFGLAEFFQWMKQLSLPLPVFILGGVFLSIASNYDRRAGFPFNQLPSNFIHPLGSRDPESSPIGEPVMPVSSVPRSSDRPISFTIRKPES